MKKTGSIDIHKVFARYFPGIVPWAYALSEALSEGSICIDPDNYITEIATGLRTNPCISENESLTVDKLYDSDFVTDNPAEELRPFVYDKGKLLYMQRYHAYQASIVEKIKSLVEAEAQGIQARIHWLDENKNLINAIFTSGQTAAANNGLEDIEKIDWQKVAALNACLHNFSIITGGPGTGKTTTVAKILAILYNQNPDLKVALAAPTGKAAARLGESLRNSVGLNTELAKVSDKINGLVPKTIHRLLEPIPQSTLFRRNSKDPLGHDLIIIDEASMVDAAIMYKLLDAVVPESRIIFLGDMNQLASVEAGSVFGDLCKTQPGRMNWMREDRLAFCNRFLDMDIPDDMTLAEVDANPLSQHVIQLYRNYRAESAEITGICKMIIDGQEEELTNLLDDGQQILAGSWPESQVRDNNADSNIRSMAEAYIDYIIEPEVSEALKKLKSFRMLCALREGKNGVYKMNRVVEQLLKARIDKDYEGRDLFNPSGTFYHNQAIMVTSNNYELDVFNGDIGLIRRKSDDDPTLVAWFESDDPERPKEILPGYLNDWEPVYAMTIHKSQGSEFDSVAVILPESENNRILTRELLYTAVSRAKRRLLIKSSCEVLRTGVRNQVRRASGIQEMF